MKKLLLFSVVVITAIFLDACTKPTTEPTPHSALKTTSVNGNDGMAMAKKGNACNNDHAALIRMIKQTKPTLSDRDLLAELVDKSPLCDVVMQEVLRRGQPPANAPVSKETLQLLLLKNLPLSDHMKKEVLKDYSSVLNRSLVEKIVVADLPDMKLEKSNAMMESLLNLKYGNAALEIHELKSRSTTFQVEAKLKGNEYYVEAQKFLDVVNQMKLQCTADRGSVHLENPTNISCGILAVDIKITTDPNPKVGNKIFNVKLTTHTALKFPSFILNCDFDNTDTWFAGLEAGRCSPNTGGSGDDAATMIGRVIQHETAAGCGAALGCSNNGGNIFYDNLQNFYVIASDGLYNGFAYDCLSQSAMNAQLNFARQMVTNYEPLNKSFVAIDMIAEIVVTTQCPGSNPCTLHSATITYGVLNCGYLPF